MAATVRFYLEAGPAVGYGHLSRCLALAASLGPGIRCVFAPRSPADGPAHARIVAAGHGVGMHASPDAVVFDGYGFTDAEIAAARSLATPPPVVAVIDDFGGRSLDCDLLICPGPQRSADDWVVPERCRLLLGPAHALLAPAFSRAAPPASPVVMRLFIGLGGVDAGDATAQIVPLVQAGVMIDVLLGPGYRGQATPGAGITLHRDLAPEAVAALMAQADAAIAAPGVMSLELAALRRPALLFATLAAQDEVGRALAAAGLAAYGGCVDSMSRAAIGQAITHFIADQPGRRAIAEACARVDPAGGAVRVAAALAAALAARDQPAQDGGP